MEAKTEPALKQEVPRNFRRVQMLREHIAAPKYALQGGLLPSVFTVRFEDFTVKRISNIRICPRMQKNLAALTLLRA
jgi:hypothetical protein